MALIREAMQKVFEIVSIGNELLIGKVVNSNASYLCKRITELGGFVRRITVVRDDLEEISSSIREAISRNTDYIITTGGLGPTFDDMSLEGVAKAFNLELEINEEALQLVKEKYDKLNEPLTPHRIKMAKLPRGAKPLKNPIGTAPGVILEEGKTKIICLPGVPKEMEAIFEDSLKEIISKDITLKFLDMSLSVLNVKESNIAPIIDEVRKELPEVYIKSHPKGYEGSPRIELHLTVTGEDAESMKMMLQKVAKLLEEKIELIGGKVEKNLS
ncbi:MAG: nicotinamide mononucleotide deamidase-related protein [Thermoproteota archaeon]